MAVNGTFVWRWVALVWWALPMSADAEPLRPYEVDAHTLHLWHLDESAVPLADAVEGGTPLLGLLNGARANERSAPGFGAAVSFNANVGGTPGNSDLRGAILLAMPALDHSTRDNVPSGFRYFGPDGAFTYEMIIKFDVLPQDAKSIALGLLTMEGDGPDRIFNFRIEKEGFLAFIPLPGSGSSGGGIATIPTRGPDAIDTTSWFHVAVTYDGNGGVGNNLKLYWTRLREGMEQANSIGSGTLSSDFNGRTADLAIGNEARGFRNNAEAEPFPGKIDEVRISGVARHPSDFLFVDPALRITPEKAAREMPKQDQAPAFRLGMTGMFVDDVPVTAPLPPNGILKLRYGLHRLDFDFGTLLDQPSGFVKLRCQLEGLDERWRQTEQGMGLVYQALDGNGRVISQSRFQAAGRSGRWETGLEDSVMSRRTEPVFIPVGTQKLRIALDSGSPDTTGFFAVNNITIHSEGDSAESIWRGGSFAYDTSTTSPAGAPPNWKRGGADPAIARMIMRGEAPVIGLVDGDQLQAGEWFSEQTLPPSVKRGRVVALSWDEAFNVFGGRMHRATYINVPSGQYTFRAIGVAGDDQVTGDQLSLTIVIPPPFWKRFWFWPLISAGLVTVLASVIFAFYRSRAKRAVERLRFQNALEKDRMRIARDMHDDLGSRVTFINMSAAMARRDLETSPENARRHLARVTASARELVGAMDDLVWAVDPAHDSLDDLASHIARLADDMFRDSSVRCRLEIPSDLPPLPLGSDFRHHIALAVKEAMHNVLRHAGPCEAFVSLEFDGSVLRVTVRDTGVGLAVDAADRSRHGLDNLVVRLKEIGGACEIESSAGAGTCVVLSCPIARKSM